MKEKLEILIEEDIIDLAKLRAVEEDRPLNDLIEDAVVAYLSRKVPDLKKREEAYKIFCEQPIQITRDQFEEILKEEVLGL
jgi:hypothetical protein